MISPTEGWAVGGEYDRGGVILYWNGLTWTRLSIAIGNWLNSVVIASPNDGWAVGEGGTIIHWNGSDWVGMTSPTTMGLHGVAVTSGVDAWVVGEGGTILHWDGQEWSQKASPTNSSLSTVTMVLPTDGWAAGWDGTILRWNGSVWTKVPGPATNCLNSIAIVSPIDGWAVGCVGTILHWDGSSWQPFTTTTSSPDFSGNACFRRRMGRRLLRPFNPPLERPDLERSNAPTDLGLSDLAMISPTEGWAVGGYGTVLRWNGSSWVEVPWPNQRRAVCRGDGFRVRRLGGWWAMGFAVDDSPLGWGSGTWRRIDNPGTNALLSVAQVSNSDAWAVGVAGIILHWNGSEWTETTSPTSKTLTSVAMASATDGWAVGGFDGAVMLHWDGGAWHEVSIPTTAELSAVLMVSPSDGWIVGESGTISSAGTAVGCGWTVQRLSLCGLSKVSPTDIWAAGYGGAIVHFDGSKWTQVASPVNTLQSISMVSDTDGWAVGGGGTIIHWDGNTWTEIAGPTGDFDWLGVAMRLLQGDGRWETLAAFFTTASTTPPTATGYNFQNGGSHTSWDTFRETFGADAVEWNVNGRVEKRLEADVYYHLSYKCDDPKSVCREITVDGNCGGMSASSMLIPRVGPILKISWRGRG